MLVPLRGLWAVPGRMLRVQRLASAALAMVPPLLLLLLLLLRVKSPSPPFTTQRGARQLLPLPLQQWLLQRLPPALAAGGTLQLPASCQRCLGEAAGGRLRLQGQCRLRAMVVQQLTAATRSQDAPRRQRPRRPRPALHQHGREPLRNCLWRRQRQSCTTQRS